MTVAVSTTIKGLCLLLTVLVMVVLTACGTSGTDPGGSGSMRDPWEAYRLEKGKNHLQGDMLAEAMSKNPPAAILLRPAVYYRMYYKPIPLGGEFLLERGKSVNISLDLGLVPVPGFGGKNISIKSSITLKYDGKRGGDLFHVDTSTYGNPTLYIDGKYITKFGNHVVKGKVAEMPYIASTEIGIDDELFEIPLHVDKGDATRADGNIGIVYIRIVGVKR